MNKQELIEKVVNLQNIKNADLAQLKELANKYSFSPVFSLLYLSGLAQHNAFTFEEELKNHAYKIPDRAQLYNVTEGIERNNVAALDETQTNTQSDTQIIRKTETNLDNQDRKENNKQVKPLELTDNENIKQEDAKAEKTIKEQDLIKPELKALEEQKLKTPSHTTVNKQEQHNLTKTNNTEIEDTKTEKENKPANKAIGVDSVDLDILANAVSQTIEKEVEQEFVSFSLDVDKEIIPEKNVENSSLQFMDWLKQQKAKEKDKPQSIKESKNQNTQTLVDSFIEKEPQISRPKKEFFSPSKVAKKSLDENAVPTSETLAKIFEAQGNYPKAILSYRQLILKFPEKKSFFANQIKNLEKKLNTK